MKHLFDVCKRSILYLFIIYVNINHDEQSSFAKAQQARSFPLVITRDRFPSITYYKENHRRLLRVRSTDP